MRSKEEIKEAIKQCELDLKNNIYQADTKALIKEYKNALEWVLDEKCKVICLFKESEQE